MKYFSGIIFITVLILSSCEYLPDGGTLGSVNSDEYNCTESELSSKLNYLSEIREFKISANDTTLVKRWDEGGYDFLNYQCLRINKRLYMISTISSDLTTSNLGIRSVYSRRKKKWIFAVDFDSKEMYNAENDLGYLVSNISDCE